jgi:hypothetical protein
MAGAGLVMGGVTGGVIHVIELEDALSGTTQMMATPGGGPPPPRYRPFTAENFRYNLGQLTGRNPSGSQAHHVLIQARREFFERLGINIDDPVWGSWWETAEHGPESLDYQNAWVEWIEDNPTATRGDVLDHAIEMAHEWGFDVNF